MKTLTILAGVAVTLVPAISLAAYVSAGASVVLPPAPAGGANAYLVGGIVNAENQVNGDLLAAGGTVIITSKAQGDIMAAGGTVNILGASAQDVRVAGGNVTVGGNFTGELMAAGGSVTVTPQTTIAKDSYIVGGTLNFLGFESGALTLAGSDIRIDGTVNGNVIVNKANKVTIGSLAVVRGGLEYSAPVPVVIEQGGQVLGQTTFHKIETPAQSNAGFVFASFITILAIVKFLAALTAAYLLWYLRRKDMIAVIEDMCERFWKNLLYGFAFLVLVPVAAIILFVTVIGSIPAIVALLVYAALLVLATPVALLVATSGLLQLFKRNKTALTWYLILIGSLIFSLVSIIPFVGWIICLIIYLVSLGGLFSVLKTKFQ